MASFFTADAGALSVAVREFFVWWGTALRSLVPDFWRWRNRRPRLVLRWGAGEAVLSHWRSGQETILFRGEPKAVSPALADASARAIRPVFVSLEPDQVFRRTLLLPGTALPSLPKLIEHEIDRQTPFSASQIYFDYRVSQRDAANQQVAVELVVAKRSIIEQVRRVVDESGHALAAVGVAGGDSVAPALDFLARRSVVGGRDAISWLNRSLAAVAVMLAAACAVLALKNLDEDIVRVTAQVTRARADALQADTLRREVERLAEASTFLMRRKATPASLAPLREATMLLPDSVWVYEFQLTGKTLRIAGYAADAPGLIAAFEKSPLLANAQFRAPVARIANHGVDRFDLSLEVRVPGAGASP